MMEREKKKVSASFNFTSQNHNIGRKQTQNTLIRIDKVLKRIKKFVINSKGHTVIFEGEKENAFIIVLGSET